MSKEGIGYFSFDTDFFHTDKKVKLIKSEFGAKGVVMLIYSLCVIYSDKGYYMKWGDDDCYLASEDLGCDCSPKLIGEVINRCVKRGIFNEEVFNAFGVLTSHGIQIRFLKAASKREKIKIIKEYALFDLNELRAGMRNKVTFFNLKDARFSGKVARSDRKVARSHIKKESKERNNIIVASPAEPEPATVTFPDGSFEIRCVDMLIHSCLKSFPSSKVPGTLLEKQKWAAEIDRMKRLDGRTEGDIIQALNYAVNDPFWQTNIRSAKKFREKFETLIVQSKGKRGNCGSSFNNFRQNSYDFDELEKELLSN